MTLFKRRPKFELITDGKAWAVRDNRYRTLSLHNFETLKWWVTSGETPSTFNDFWTENKARAEEIFNRAKAVWGE